MLLLPSQALSLTLFSDESAELQKSKTIELFRKLTRLDIIEMDRLLQLGRGGPGMGAAGQGTVVNQIYASLSEPLYSEATQYDTAEQIHISSLALLKMMKHGRAGVPFEVMGLMLGEFVDDYTVRYSPAYMSPYLTEKKSRGRFRYAAVWNRRLCRGGRSRFPGENAGHVEANRPS